MEIRKEAQRDISTIREVTEAAFKGKPYSQQTEGAIIDALRSSNALTVSLVAIDAGELIGHIAFSPVTINQRAMYWYGLGPVAVRPDHQNNGIGARLVKQGLEQIKRMNANGCVLLGNPAYYSRFGFAADSRLHLKNVPAKFFQIRSFTETVPTGEVRYHSSFDAT